MPYIWTCYHRVPAPLKTNNDMITAIRINIVTAMIDAILFFNVIQYVNDLINLKFNYG
jgi:hypothetical protein